MFVTLSRFLRRLARREAPEESFERKERDRLSAEYTGSFAKAPGDRYGLRPPK